MTNTPSCKHVWLTVLLLSLALGACQSTPHRNRDTQEEINAALKTPAPAAEADQPPPEVSAALLPPMRLELPSAPVEQRFDIQVNDAPAREFFMSLVQGTPLNMVVHPAVDGLISLTLKNVTVGEALDAVRDVYGYEYQRTTTGYQVMPIRLQSRIFQVSYLNIRREGKSDTRVSSGEVSQSSSQNNNNNSSGSTGSTNNTVTSLPSSRIETKSSSDFWTELNAALTAIVGNGEGRSVVLSPQSGVVVVRAMPSELREVAAFLVATQDNLNRQVVLEAKIIEVELSDGFQSGINWAALGKPGTGKTIIGGQTGGGTFFGTGASEIAGNTGTLNPGALSPVEGTDTSAFGGVFSLALSLNDFTAFIELLKTQGDVQVLSSPRVSTVNNQKAVIKVGSDEFFITDISATTTTGTASTTENDITLTPFFSGIALDVTPQISEDGNVTLHIHPSVSEVTDQTKTFTISDREQSLPLAFSKVRESDSIVRARSGQVVVIGGLMQNIIRDKHAGVPGLGDIPGIGGAFRHTQKVGVKSELVILLRPVVVDNGSAWNDQINQSARRIESMQPSAAGMTGN